MSKTAYFADGLATFSPWGARRAGFLPTVLVAVLGLLVCGFATNSAHAQEGGMFYNPTDPEDDEYSGRMFAGFGNLSTPRSSSSSSNAPPQAPSAYAPGEHPPRAQNGGPAYPGNAPTGDGSPAVTTNPSSYRYTEDAWQRPLPSARGVFDPENSAATRPVIAPDNSIGKRRSGLEERSEEYDEFASLKSGLLRLTGQEPNTRAAKELYDEGMEHYAARRYGQAASSFGWAEFRAPDIALKEDSLFMQAESHFFARNYQAAQKAYLELLVQYKHSARRDLLARRLFSIAQYWEDLDANRAGPIHIGDSRQPLMDTFGAAMRTYQAIWVHDPSGDLADDSLMAAGCGYYQKRRFDDAAFHFRNIRQDYASSEHIVDAYKFEIACRMAMYHGPEYDGTTLHDAERLINQALVQFGPQLGEDRKELTELKSKIHFMKAERDWTLAQYYDKKQLYRGARIYYESLQKEYPRTPFAEMAEKRVREIAGEPDKPSRVVWVTDMFGAEEATSTY